MRALTPVILVLVSACGGGDPPSTPAKVACPGGTRWNGAVCTAMVDTSCPEGTSYIDGRGCVASVEPAALPAPTHARSAPVVEEVSGVPRTVWMKRMAEILPPALCESKTYFRNCFVNLGDAECASVMTDLTRSCLRDHASSLPDQFDQDNGRREGTKIGTCVGAAFDVDMRGKGRFINSAECNDVSRWQ
jgi:hypothetical protein